jgi:hypothetical protein
MSDERIAAALRALANQDAGKEAPAEVETRILQTVRQRRALRVRLQATAWMAAAAAVVALIFFWKGDAPRTEPVAKAPAVEIEQPQAVAPPPTVPAPPRRVAKAAPARPAPPREVVTEFYPLVDVAPPFERGQLIRVNLPAAALRNVGLPVADDRLSDRIQADVLVGEEGTARAIRFVKSVR